MAETLDVHSSANRSASGSRAVPRGKQVTEPVRCPAKLAKGSDSNRPSQKSRRTAVGHSDESGPGGYEYEQAEAPLPAASPTLPVVIGLRPRQILAASLLAQGQPGKEVAATLGIAPETLSRWKHQPEFERVTRQLLQDSIDAARLGLVSLCAESVVHLRGLVRSFDDKTALKAITLVLGKVGPVLGVIGAELRKPPADRRRRST